MTVSFHLSPEQEQLKLGARQFAGEHLRPLAAEVRTEVINRLMNVVGVQAYDNNFPLMAYLSEALAYPVIEGSNIGIRRRQLQELFRTPGYNPLSASGMA
jgi:nitroalkane oxidase